MKTTILKVKVFGKGMQDARAHFEKLARSCYENEFLNQPEEGETVYICDPNRRTDIFGKREEGIYLKKLKNGKHMIFPGKPEALDGCQNIICFLCNAVSPVRRPALQYEQTGEEHLWFVETEEEGKGGEA